MSTDFTECINSWASWGMELELTDEVTFKDKAGNVQGESSIPCRVQPTRLRSKESVEGGRTTGTDFVDLLVPAGTPVQNWYRAHVTFSTGQTVMYFVKGTPQPTTDEWVRTVLCEKSEE